ncbi:hypothetical protein AJ80_01443 [Polytolypa hystricis UAMH7299]|uniref:Stress response RCI peptide n=1 Tax=Polytolypa hystricis (strain UAMH7299) TaxID=1447883 RepID=A0A2B7Z0L4_POLH7|nr:hypothetical protein AJ80_01443 [Polytolypa hystricis UAMH7299]
MCTPDVFLAILAVLFPPVAVWIKVGVCTADSLINIALCCLGYVPGLLHAWYIILKYPEHDDEYPEGYQPIVGSRRRDPEGGRVTYYYVAHQPPSADQSPQHRSYGTNASPGPQQSPHVDQATRPAPKSQSPQPSQQDHPTNSAGEGSSTNRAGESRAPPTYAEAVKGDHKIQTRD